MIQTPTNLPRLLYVGDVAVEASHHGSALLYRLFEDYAPERLCIVESNLQPSQPARRLPGVRYACLSTGSRRCLNTRLHGLYSTWLSWTAPARAARARALFADFSPDAIITVAHGYGWLTAASLALKLGVPLHLIVHDDWPRLGGIAPAFRSWLERRFAKIYRRATTRLCVSPFMVEEYERRYGVAGSVLYPSRSSDCPVFKAAESRLLKDEDELVIGYGGNSNPEVRACLKDLLTALAGFKARLSIFGPFGMPIQQELLAISSTVTFHGLVPYKEMISGLRASADILFVPMAFDAAARDNMIVSFPSKLADYTAIGLPILIYGPPHCSAVRWARLHPNVAEVVDVADPAKLLLAVRRLKADRAWRGDLANKALEAGNACFSSDLARKRLYVALKSPENGIPGMAVES